MPPVVWILFGVVVALGISGALVRWRYERVGEEAPWGIRVGFLALTWAANVTMLAFALHGGLRTGSLAGLGPAFLGMSMAILGSLFIAPELTRGWASGMAWLLTGAVRQDSLPALPGLDEAKAAMKRQEWERAEALLRQALAARPDHHDARSDLAGVLEKRGKIAEAAAEMARAGADTTEPHTAAARVFRAVELWTRAGQPGPARGALEALIARVAGTKLERYARDRLKALES